MPRDTDHDSSSEEEAPAMGPPASERSSPNGAEAPPAPAGERTAKGYVLAWCQKLFYVPAESVVGLLPKCPKPCDDGAALGGILASKSPEVWRDACHGVFRDVSLQGEPISRSVGCGFLPRTMRAAASVPPRVWVPASARKSLPEAVEASCPGSRTWRDAR